MPPYAAAGSAYYGRHYRGAVPHFPYRFLSVADTGQVATSADGAAWIAGVSNISALNLWGGAALKVDGSLLMVAGTTGAANQFAVATSSDGDAFTEFLGAAPGKAAGTQVVGLFHSTIFGVPRWFAQVRQSGGSVGGVWYSDDDGVTWASMAFAGAPAPTLDPGNMAIGTDRIVVFGQFFADGVGVNRMFFSTDGLTFAAGAVGISSLGLWLPGDGNAHCGIYIPGTDRFVFGASQLGGGSPEGITTQDGTAVLFTFPMGGGSSARCGNGCYMSGVGLAVCPFINAGILPGTTASHQTNPTFSAWLGPLNTFPPDGRCYNLAYSVDNGRAVGGQTSFGAPGGFMYTDDGTSFTNAAAPAVRNWRNIVSGF